MRFNDGSSFVKNLVKEYCPDPTVSNIIRLQTYFNKATNMYNLAIDFLKQGNNARAYIELMRFSQLAIKFSEHNSYNEKQYQRERNLNKRRLNNAIMKLEELKPKIVEEYNAQIKLEEENAAKAALNAQNNQNQNQNVDNNANNNDISNNNNQNNNNNANNNDINNNNNNNNNNEIDEKKNDNNKNNLPANERWGNLLLPSQNDDNNNNNNNGNNGLVRNNSMDSIFSSPKPHQQEIILPTQTVDGFVKYASANTKNDIETCGVLCGRHNPKNDNYIVTHVIIPKQKGSSNTVQTLAEEELITIQEKNSIIQLGWIHTHPSQTCFLSSVDMHCQLSYQIMMPNGIAIVHAPTDTTQVFTLTSKGVDVLSKCNCQGFHRHEGVKGIYEVARHAKWSNKHKVKFIDLRNKKVN